MSPRISFIIPAHDEAEHIGAAADAARRAGEACGVSYEVIVACDACADDTASIAQRAGARTIDVDHRQISRTRNSGADAADGDIFIFVDADTIISPSVVREAMDAMERGAVAGGAPVRFDGVTPLYARLMLPVAISIFRVFRFTGGACLFCASETFSAVGGFSEELFASEEVDFARRIHAHAGRKRFVVLRGSVLTSGRKLRTHSMGEILGLLCRLAIRGGKTLRNRDALGLWYGPRRPEED